MQRMFNMDQWTVLNSGESLNYDKSRPRGVVLEVNSMYDALLFLTEGSDTKYVARFCGRDTITFTVNGPFKLSVEPADRSEKGVTTWIYTAEGQHVHTTLIEPEIFTRMHQRQERDPEAELLRYRMQQSMEAGYNALLAKAEREINARMETLVNPTASAAIPVGQQSPQADGSASSGGETAPAPAGSPTPVTT